jgi:(p)ppGpp synthase/HD superfamily hydrolase
MRAHEGQFRRDSCTPYFQHVLDVAHRLQDCPAHMIAAGYLHDVIEDTDTETGEIFAEFGKKVHDLVIVLTRLHDETYEDFINRINAGDPEAITIKVCDILANLSDNPTPKQIRKYAKALLVLVKE